MLSLIVVMAVIICTIPFMPLPQAEAKSNASALTALTYKTGTYTTLKSLTLYTKAGGSTSARVSVAKNKAVKVTSVSGHYGKVTVNKKSGWIDLTYAYNTANTVDIPSRLNMLRKKFPDGKYWNREKASVNNADGYTDTPCKSKHTDKRDNYFDGTCQCHGFALKLGYDLFGIHASYWQRHYDLSKVVVGDLIRYRSCHTVMVTGVFKDYFTVADCNYGYDCDITWDRRMQKSFFSPLGSGTFDGIYHCQINTTNKTQTLTTTVTPNVQDCLAILKQSDDVVYYAYGVMSGGKTTFTFKVPTGTYQQMIIASENCDDYVINKFVLGKSKLPTSISLTLYGDVNSDGRVNNNDVTQLLHYLAGWNVSVNKKSSDVNKDGAINGKDVTAIKQYAKGWSGTLGNSSYYTGEDDDWY